MRALTLILPYYRSPEMLRVQRHEIAQYPDGLHVIVIDDCSPEPASEIVTPSDRIGLYRIHDDIPWNRNGARNLGAHVATTEWILQTDIDHVLPADAAAALLALDLDAQHWYRFPRYRVGPADETRRKDPIGDGVDYGRIREHIDSYMITRDLYWRTNGYNEDFSGCFGGGSAFLKRLAGMASVQLLELPVRLHVHTRHSVPDASVTALVRDRTEYERRRKLFAKQTPEKPLRFEWSKVN
jgi:hypothetical protein